MKGKKKKQIIEFINSNNNITERLIAEQQYKLQYGEVSSLFFKNIWETIKGKEPKKAKEKKEQRNTEEIIKLYDQQHLLFRQFSDLKINSQLVSSGEEKKQLLIKAETIFDKIVDVNSQIRKLLEINNNNNVFN
jgi:hypothetical protein